MPAAPGEDVRRAVIAARASSRMVWQTWRDEEPARAMAEAFASDDPAMLAAGLRDLLADDAWVAAILTPLADALARDRFFEPPFKVSRDDARTSAILHDCPHGSLIATVTSARAMAMRPPPGTVIVPGRMSICRYHRAGGARLARWRVAGERVVPIAPVNLSDGMVVAFDGRAEAQMLAGAAHDVVSITATMRQGQAAVMREYDRASGRPLRAATLDEGGARNQMLLALLLHLAERAGDYVSRRARLDSIWGLRIDPGTNVVAVHVSRLRAKIDRGFASPLIGRERGKGYRLAPG